MIIVPFVTALQAPVRLLFAPHLQRCARLDESEAIEDRVEGSTCRHMLLQQLSEVTQAKTPAVDAGKENLESGFRQCRKLQPPGDKPTA